MDFNEEEQQQFLGYSGYNIPQSYEQSNEIVMNYSSLTTPQVYDVASQALEQQQQPEQVFIYDPRVPGGNLSLVPSTSSTPSVVQSYTSSPSTSPSPVDLDALATAAWLEHTSIMPDEMIHQLKEQYPSSSDPTHMTKDHVSLNSFISRSATCLPNSTVGEAGALPSMFNTEERQKVYVGNEPANCTRAWQCTKCPKNYFDRCGLQAHDRRVHGPYKTENICSICQMGFDRPSKLKIHEKTHVGETNFICPVCLGPFRSKLSCDNHMRFHQTESTPE